MNEIIKFKNFIEFDLRCGEIKEMKEDRILVDIGADDLVICDKGNFEYSFSDKVILFLIGNEGRILAVDNSLLSVDKDVENGNNIS